MRDCDLCDDSNYFLIPQLPGSTVCANCGFVHVKERRNAEEIAKAWDDLWQEAYTSAWPGVIARLTYVTEFCEQTFGWKDKQVLDIGAGEGTFMKMVYEKGGRPTGVEPSPPNHQKILLAGYNCHLGTAESVRSGQYDVVTLNWTLENTGDCMAVLKKARSLLKPGGLIVVATGSRILVPFKKPFSTYVSDLPPDLHCYRWSAISLRRALSKAGFATHAMNDFDQNDAMVCIGMAKDALALGDDGDNPQAILRYFESWKEMFP